jgi:hypothetical protein
MSDEIRILTRLTQKPSGSTNWNAYDLAEIWQMVQSENSYVTWEQRDAWRRMALLCEDQAKMLASAVAELQQHWPARPGSASESFGVIVNAFVAAMRQSAADALTNRDAVGTIAVEIGTTRAMISSLVEQYHRYEAAERMLLPQPTPSPGQSVPQLPTEAARPPQNWRELLDIEARTVMSSTDTKVGQEAQRFASNPYETYVERSTVFDPDPGAGVPPPAGGSPVIPALAFDPPPVRLPPGTPSGIDGGSSPGVDSHGDGGVVLQGSPTPPGQPGTGSTPWAFSSWTPTDALSSGRSHSGGGLPGQLPGVAIIGRTAAGGMMPPQAATNSAPATQPRAGQSLGSPIPPVMGAPMAQPAQRGGSVAPGGHTPGYRDRNRRRDPDDPWGTREGNPAVIEPPPEPGEHSPGLGVLGLDR